MRAEINEWSIVPTPDGLGVSLKPMEESAANDYEVCVGLRDGWIDINIHIDGVFEPVKQFSMLIPKGEE